MEFIRQNRIPITLVLCLLVLIVLPWFSFKKFRRHSMKAIQQISSTLGIVVGHASAIGRRPTMEDNVMITLDTQYISEIDDTISANQQIAAFGVFDGHCGSAIAEHAGKTFSKFLSARQDCFSTKPELVCQAVCSAFLDFDKSTEQMPAGSTACVAIINQQNMLFVANAGDSRAVLIKSGHAVPMSIDHKPGRESERQRIQVAGGDIKPTSVYQAGCLLQLGPARIWPGGLSVSRGFGDHNMKQFDQLQKEYLKYKTFSRVDENFADLPKLEFYKQMLVSPFPEIHYTQLDDSCEAMVVACDGLYDVMTPGDVCKILQQNIARCMIKAIEQVAIRNIEKCIPEYQDQLQQNFVSSFVNWSQKSFAKLKFGLMHKFDEYVLPDDLLQQADFLAAQMLAEKLVNIALQRESQDNVSCLVCILRFEKTFKTIKQWHTILVETSRFEQLKKMIFKNHEISENDKYQVQDNADYLVRWSSTKDPSAKWL